MFRDVPSCTYRNPLDPRLSRQIQLRASIVYYSINLGGLDLDMDPGTCTKFHPARYTGPDYDILRKNCCHFADAFCRRLGGHSCDCICGLQGCWLHPFSICLATDALPKAICTYSYKEWISKEKVHPKDDVTP